MTYPHKNQADYDNAEPEFSVKFSETLGYDEWFEAQLLQLLDGHDAVLPDGTIVMTALEFNERAACLFADELDKRGV